MKKKLPSRALTDVGQPRSKRILLLLCFTLFLDLVGFSIIFPLFTSMLEYYLGREGPDSVIGGLVQFLGGFAAESEGASEWLTQVLFGGVLGSLYAWLQWVAAPICGRLSDCYGRRPVLLTTLIGTGLSYLLWIFSDSFLWFVGARVLGGIMGGKLSVVSAAVADSTSPQERSKGMALIGVAFGLGFIIGPVLGGLASLVDLSVYFPQGQAIGLHPFSFAALLALLLTCGNIFWLYRQLPETLPVLKGQGDRRPVEQREIDHRGIRRTIQVYFLFILSFAGMEFSLTFLAVERLDFSPQQLAGVFLFIGLIMILVQGGIVRRYAARVGEKRMALTGLGACAVGLAVIARVPTQGLVVFFVGLGLVAMGAALAIPTLSALVSLYSDEQSQGRTLGAFRSAGALARACGPLLAALLYYRFGSELAYSTGSLFLLLPLALGFTVKPPVVPKS